MSDVVDHNNIGSWPVIGHPHVIRDLTAAVDHGPRHAYIFSGYGGLGKRTTALVFAQALLCETPSAPGVPCGHCRTCGRIQRGSHPDVSEWNLARQTQAVEKAGASRNLSINIQTVRDITASLAMRPFESRYRIAIVDDVETMQETAQEAFLKTLEEPPAYAVILLLTTSADLLLETIRSRAMTVPFLPVPAPVIQSALSARGSTPEQANELADLSEGRPGWAITAVTDPQLLAQQEYQRSEAQRWIAADRYTQVIEATRLGEAYSKDREGVFARLAALQRQWRRELLERLDENDLTGANAAVSALKSIDVCYSDLDANVRPRLALQTMVLQWPNP